MSTGVWYDTPSWTRTVTRPIQPWTALGESQGAASGRHRRALGVDPPGPEIRAVGGPTLPRSPTPYSAVLESPTAFLSPMLD